MTLNKVHASLDALRDVINNAYRMDESMCVKQLIEHAQLTEDTLQRIRQRAADLTIKVRELRMKHRGLETFLYEYKLSSEEGISLMCLAEALLRIPDKETINRLIRDKITAADWDTHLSHSDSFAVNAANWALVLTGKVLAADEHAEHNRTILQTLKRLLGRTGEPVIRRAVGQAMKIISRQFVMGRTIEDAITRAKNNEAMGYRYSYDMLGEAALTQADADKYFEAYRHAITCAGEDGHSRGPELSPGISIKLSALHPRYEFAQRERVLDELVPRLFSLACLAKEYQIGLTIDAEESRRLDLSLDIFEEVISDSALDGWNGLGLALQSYQKRGFFLIDWIVEIASRYNHQIPVRLIKGAYWDSEIKETQMYGFEEYPVFTRKQSTDVSFIACAKKILQFPKQIFPQFATHNAYSVATILELTKDIKAYEFQCLHGMGRSLYDLIVGPENSDGIPCRIYAPVGSHKDLLPYLVRRLLENGANTSFVHRIVDKEIPIEKLIEDPVVVMKSFSHIRHPRIPLPINIYGDDRKNSVGFDLTNPTVINLLKNDLDRAQKKMWSCAPIIDGEEHRMSGYALLSPIDNRKIVGEVQWAKSEDVERALSIAHSSKQQWDQVSVLHRAAMIEHAAELFEKHHAEFIYLLVNEAGKTLRDAISELREAIDYCRYYAQLARKQLAQPIALPGYTGESNFIKLHGKGVMACISPWNFPFAIFTGQVVAALVTGNIAVAKPAEQTPLIAALAIRLLHAAGIPGYALHLLPGDGEKIGALLVNDKRIDGVLFTGSTETAKKIELALAQRSGAIATLIAETGGQNTMIVDSSALPEQVVTDVITSAFGSCGQRCSSLRVLYLQNEIAEKVIEMLIGAVTELVIGDPSLLTTDVGPVINAEARIALEEHCNNHMKEGELLHQQALPEFCAHGTYFPPTIYEINSIEMLTREVFGPVLHIIRFDANQLDRVIDEINNSGYGLTLGIHSRISETIENIQSRIAVGNCYVNRNMVGAVVGVQPFGGEGLSGTGPKAGGPNFLLRLCNERVLTTNTTASGGNASLFSLQEES